MTDKYRYVYHPEEKYFVRAIGISINEIPENSTFVSPRVLNTSWGGIEPEKRFFDLVQDYYHPSASAVYNPIVSSPYLPDLFGNDPKPNAVFVNNYWTGEDWEIRNTPLADEIAKENEIVQSLLYDFFLVEKIEREKIYYILLHKKEGYETLVTSTDTEWNKELYVSDIRAIIDFIEFEFEVNEYSEPPSGNIYYYKYDSDGKYSGVIEAELHYTEKRWPNPLPENATEIAPPFKLKPPLNSTFFYWNGSDWEIRNTSVAKKLATESAIVNSLITNDGYVLVDRKKSKYKGIKIGYWYILWKKEKDSYSVVHSLDKEYFKEDFSTYDHALFEINAIETDNFNANPDEPITQEEIQESQERWSSYEAEQKTLLNETTTNELETLTQNIIDEWEAKKQDAYYWKDYYIQNMKMIADRNFEEDKFFYEIKARVAKEMAYEKS